MVDKKNEFQRVALRTCGCLFFATGALSSATGFARMFTSDTEDFLLSRMPEVTAQDAQRVRDTAQEADVGKALGGVAPLLIGGLLIEVTKKKKCAPKA
jgi:hypothetical protein